jgi:hypothetical protein
MKVQVLPLLSDTVEVACGPVEVTAANKIPAPVMLTAGGEIDVAEPALVWEEVMKV